MAVDLLIQSDLIRNWSAKWIAPADSEQEENFYFRTLNSFSVIEVPDKLVLHISAESHYILYVNGIETGRGPVRGIRDRNFYDSYNIAPLLKTGDNIIAVLVYCMNIATFVAVPAQPGVILEIENLLTTNRDWKTAPAEDWRLDVEFYTSQTGFSEWRDFRKEPQGWTLGKNTEHWALAMEIASAPGIYQKKLLPRDIPALTQDVCLPVSIPVKASVPPPVDLTDIKVARLMSEEKHYPFLAEIICEDSLIKINPDDKRTGVVFIFDFATEIIGRFELDITAPRGTVVDVGYEEELQHNRLNLERERYHFSDRYILRDGRQTIGNSINERGFRFVQIVLRNFDQPIIIHLAQAINIRYPFKQRATFDCSDTLLNRIWDSCQETLRACTTDVYTDCPWRERTLWLGDVLVENKTALELFGDPRVSRRVFKITFAQADEQGLLPNLCTGTWMIASSCLYIVHMLKDYLMYSGDKALIRELLPQMEPLLETVSRWSDDDHLLMVPEGYKNFFDWSFELNEFDGQKTSLINYLYIMSMKTTMELAEFVGIDIDRVKYQRRIEQTADACNKYFFKDHENLLADCLDGGVPSEKSSQLAHAFALLSGEFNPEHRAHLINALGNKNVKEPELFLFFFVFEAMKKYDKKAAGLATIRKYWGDMVRSGSPTIWEYGVYIKGKQAANGSGSLCHAFSISPVDFFQTVILGIAPLAPGFSEFKVAPDPMDLDSAAGTIPTPHGDIFIKWMRNADNLDVELQVPDGTTAVTEAGRVFTSGKHKFNCCLRDSY
ncbi:MAG: glycoside hydrolase family 78 protein [Victivallaceae bacterium]|nr:glycoside hydrolase family 78 protein [Victivallaceae bacterium]